MHGVRKCTKRYLNREVNRKHKDKQVLGCEIKTQDLTALPSQGGEVGEAMHKETLHTSRISGTIK